MEKICIKPQFTVITNAKNHADPRHFPSDKKIPQHKRPTKRTRPPKNHLRRAPPLCRAPKLPIPTPHVLNRRERIVYKAVDVLGLHVEVTCELALQFGDFDEGFFGCTGVC